MFSLSSPSQVARYACSKEGWLGENEAELLYNWSRGLMEGVIVEIGSWKGRSTIALAAGRKSIVSPICENRAHVFAVDHFTGSSEHRQQNGNQPCWTLPDFLRNLDEAELLDQVVPLGMGSPQAAVDFPFPIGLLWIDGAHEEDLCLQDYLAWEPHLLVGGRIAFHDSGMAGPMAARKRMDESGRFEPSEGTGTIYSAIKKAKA